MANFKKIKLENSKTSNRPLTLKERGKIFKGNIFGISWDKGDKRVSSENPGDIKDKQLGVSQGNIEYSVSKTLSEEVVNQKNNVVPVGPENSKAASEDKQEQSSSDPQNNFNDIKKLHIHTNHSSVKQGRIDHPILEVEDVFKSFITGVQEVPVLKDINFKVNAGDFMVIFGPSGCGKSTMLHTLLGLEEPTKGRVIFMGNDLYSNTNEDDRAVIRKKSVGMIYQQPNWVKALNVVQNVAFPLVLMGMEKEQSESRALAVLEQLSMTDWATYTPTELSSGQQQRIALARALINDPAMIVADEPTGNLDYESGQAVMKLLSSLNQEQDKTIIMVTHDLEYLRYSKTALRMLDGQVVGIYDASQQEELFKNLQYKRGVKNI